jgi:hypothetical protein
MPSEAQRVRAIVEWRLILDEFQPKIIALTLWRAHSNEEGANPADNPVMPHFTGSAPTPSER